MTKLRWIPWILAVVLLPRTAVAQERSSVSGQVVAQGSGEPLAAVRVAIPALNISTMTDARGGFLLPNIPLGNHTLRVQLIGRRPVTREVSVGADMATVTIEMAADPLRLDERVVTGYGEQRRRDIAGAVVSLKPSENVPEAAITSMAQGLQGRLTGVTVIQNSGTPGAAITVRVRGSSSISGGNDPLYVIDGVPVNQGNFSALNMGFGGQDIDALSDLNPTEIESIEVLKDASAAAIYGSRASNGVVLITTKRGTAGRPEISFGSYYGVQRDWRRLDLLNAQQYLDVYNEGSVASDGPATDYGYDEWFCYEDPTRTCWQEWGPQGTDTDWLAEVMRSAPMSSLEGSVRGGTERVRYYVSGSSLKQEGIIQAMGYRRLNGRVNLDYTPFDRLSFGTNVSLAHSVTDRARSDNTIYGAFANAIANPPVMPVFDQATGDYYETLYANPVGMNREAEAEERAIRILGNAFTSYTLVEGITARASVGLDQLTMRSRSYDSPVFGPWASSGGSAQAGTNFATKATYEATVNFNRLLMPGHEVSGVLGGSYEDNLEEFSFVQGTQFPTEYFKYITSAASIEDGESTRTDWGLTSYFGRVSYTYNDRVTATFNIRRDGSSRFGAANRFGTFPSAAVLWRVGDEAFMQGQGLFDQLALRVSYGVTGNQQALGNFASRGLFGGGENYLDLPGISPTQLANPELRWEKTAQLNVGTDFSVFSDRLAISFDYYEKKTDDLLVQRPVPRTTGFNFIWSNVGSMENKGFEVTATARVLAAPSPQGVKLSTTVNLSRNRNKVTALYNNQPINSGFANRVDVGEPLGFFFGHQTVGLFQSAADICLTQTGETSVQRNARCAAAGLAFQNSATSLGDIRFRDINGDGVINDADRTKIGSPWPDIEGGITNTLSFHGFDLTAFVQFSLGNEIFNANGIYTDQFGSGGDNHTTRALRRWTPANPNTDEPRAIWGDPNQNTRDSDRFIEDGSYWRLKNLVLGYTLPGSLASRIGYRTLRVYVQAQNLLTFTDYSGFDPEVHFDGATAISRGTDFYTLPQARTITFGFTVGL